MIDCRIGSKIKKWKGENPLNKNNLSSEDLDEYLNMIDASYEADDLGDD